MSLLRALRHHFASAISLPARQQSAVRRAASAAVERLEGRRLFAGGLWFKLSGLTGPVKGDAAAIVSAGNSDVVEFKSGYEGTWQEAGSLTEAIQNALTGSETFTSTSGSGWTNTITWGSGAFRIHGGSIIAEDKFGRMDSDNDYDDWSWTIKYEFSDEQNCGCDCPPETKNDEGGSEPGADPYSEGPVSYFDGAVSLVSSDLDVGSIAWGASRRWTNEADQALRNTLGAGWVSGQMPHIVEQGRSNFSGSLLATSYQLVLSGKNSISFTRTGSGASAFTTRFGVQGTLTESTVTEGGHSRKLVTYTDAVGQQYTFYGYNPGSSSVPALPEATYGAFRSFTDRAGNVTTASYDSTTGALTEITSSVTAGGVTTTDSMQYTVVSGTPSLTSNAGLIESILHRRKVGAGLFQNVRTVEYEYHDGSDAHGSVGDLKRATVKDYLDSQTTPETVERKYYRYYKQGDSNGYAHAMKYALEGESYAHALGAGVDPLTATDGQLAPFADYHYQFDSEHRVTYEVAQGAGCSSCTGGQGAFSFSYTDSAHTKDYNNWARRTEETLPDGNQHIVYTNGYGQVMLKILKNPSTGQEWKDFYRYDEQGRMIRHANPSAVSGYNDTFADLVGYNANNNTATYLYDNQGLIELTAYAAADSVSISQTEAGDAGGYVSSRSIQRGDTGTPILQETLAYYKRVGATGTTYPVASSTVYRNDNGTGGQTTTYSYTWQGTTTQAASVNTTMPTVTTAQNGPNSAAVSESFFDAYGRTIWTKDADGFINHVVYDAATGAAIKSITDVVYASLTSDEQTSFSTTGWSQPSGGLHLTTTMAVDALGRTTKLTDPKGNVTFMVYNDAEHETRVYRGWNPTTGTTTGPIEVTREDRDLKYTEMLTMSAAPAVSGTSGSYVPTGTESVSNVESLSRSYVNDSGQVIHSDVYVVMPGGGYSTAATLGTEGTHYHRTSFAYDQRGRQKRVENPNGTITWTLYDGLGRTTSQWIGTDDTGATNGDPDGSGGSNNMIKVVDYQYDGGIVGDSLLTKVTQIPGGGAADRVSETFHDWRGRVVAAKAAVEVSESDNAHPITYMSLNNLGQAVWVAGYDADGITIARNAEAGGADADGVPNAPAQSARRSYGESDYDEWGRVFASRTFAVVPEGVSAGDASANSLLSQAWFDKRGNLIKAAQPGGLVSKSVYDGAGRITTSYTSDGGGDTGYSDAQGVASDRVLGQLSYTYDANGNVILTTAKQRFHDETGTSPSGLGDATNAPNARVSYSAVYYDAIDRVTASVNVGTNGGTAYTRPGSVPSRSDTVLVTSYTYDAAGRLFEVSDPKDLETRYSYDLRGQTLSVTENYVNGSPSDADDRITRYTYDGNGNVLTMTADLSGTDQTTAYVYGVTTAGGSSINSNDLLKEVQYPDASTGAASTAASDKEQYTYNALGQVKTMTDQNGNVHTYSYDVLGRMTADAVTTLGSGVDGTVRRQEVRYNTQGQADQFTQKGLTQSVSGLTRSGVTATASLTAHGYAVGDSVIIAGANQAAYNGTFVVVSVPTANSFTYTMASDPGASATGTLTAQRLVNQIQRQFNGLSQMTTEWQAVNGAVSTGSTPKVQYAYSEMASGANHSRLEKMTYPNGRILRHEYSSGLDDSISRVSFQADDASGAVGTHLEDYSYLGLSTIVERNHPESGINLTYVGTGTGDGGDKYVGLDRFGRVVDHRWVDVAGAGTSDDRDADRFRYSYDANSNRTSREWDSSEMPPAFKGDEAYIYDDLNRLTKANRGTLASGTVADGSATWSQRWDGSTVSSNVSGYDALGNWKGVYTDTDGAGATAAGVQTRGHNSQNQITSVAGATSPQYDQAGNMVSDEGGIKYTYDAWGRTKAVKTPSNVDRVVYTLDPLGRRVVQDVTASGVGGDGQLYYSANWQVLEEREDLGSGYVTRWQNVHSLAYVDSVVARDTIDSGTAAGSTDNSFSGDGKYTFSVSAGIDFFRYVTQTDGKIVAVGDANGSTQMVVARFNTDGTLDSTFNYVSPTVYGYRLFDIGTTDQAHGVAIQNDGKIVIVGYSSDDLALLRLNNDGSLDTSFDGPGGTPGNGYFTINLSGTDNARDVVIQDDGQILVGGISGGNFFLGRFNKSNGAWDTNYDTDGRMTVDFGGTDRGFELSLDRDGKAVLVGETTTGTGGDIAIIRVNKNGTLDTSFDTDGKKTISLTSGQDSSRALEIDNQNRIVLAATGTGDFEILRLNHDGSTDNNFDTDGRQSVDFGGADSANELVLDSRGRILVAGTAGGTDMAVVRLTTAGALDTGFDADGKQTVSFAATGTETAEGMVIDNYGRIVLAGRAGTGDLAVARLGGGGARHYLIQDANFNVTATAEASGKVVDRYQYTPYGVWTALNADFSTDYDNAGEVYQAFYFQGLRFDGNSGNHHARNRDYRASLGRWTQNDPARYIDGLNQYLGFGASPENANDPTGLSIIVCDVDQYLRKNNVKGFVRTKIADNAYKYSGNARHSGSVTSEILATMIKSSRKFTILAYQQNELEKHVAARLAAIDFARNKKYKYSNIEGGIRVNEKLWSVDDNGRMDVLDRSLDGIHKAVNDLRTNPGAYSIPCMPAEIITQMAGTLNAGFKSGQFDNLGHVRLDDLAILALTTHVKDLSDWIPGDSGFIENATFDRGRHASDLAGENIIYLGKNEFWGHYSDGLAVDTLANWEARVANFTRDANGAGLSRLSAKRSFSSLGLAKVEVE